MTGNVELKRTHEGKLEMFVSGVPALNTVVVGFNATAEGLVAVISIPLKDVTISERDNVLPFKRAA